MEDRTEDGEIRRGVRVHVLLDQSGVTHEIVVKKKDVLPVSGTDAGVPGRGLALIALIEDLMGTRKNELLEVIESRVGRAIDHYVDLELIVRVSLLKERLQAVCKRFPAIVCRYNNRYDHSEPGLISVSLQQIGSFVKTWSMTRWAHLAWKESQRGIISVP